MLPLIPSRTPPTRAFQPWGPFIPFLVLLFFSTSGRVAAATLNVPTTAFPTIQAAVTAAANGDIVAMARSP